MSRLREAIAEIVGSTTEIRHDLHAQPELGYKEHRTSERIRSELAAIGVEHRGDLAGGTGVLGYIPATKPGGACIALRADMDALPIAEETGVSYSSQTAGVMHACGHDGHTAILLATARVLHGLSERPNDVLLVFQPAEEGGAGGKRMCEDGVLDGRILGRPVDTIFGLHGFPSQPVGHVSTRVGPLMAAATQFEIVVRGQGAHAAYPHHGIDPIVIASHIVTALQTIASRTVGPLDSVVVTIGKFQAGVAHNVIPDTATLSGTLRTLQDETQVTARAAIQRIAAMTAEAMGATADVRWEHVPYPVTRNDAAATERFRAVAERTVGASCVHEEPEPSMGGEDFSFYGQQVPACFYFLGLLPPGQETYPNLHSPRFDFNDAAIPVGIELMAELALAPQT